MLCGLVTWLWYVLFAGFLVDWMWCLVCLFELVLGFRWFGVVDLGMLCDVIAVR